MTARRLASGPIPVRVDKHPNVPGCFTHIISQRDANARGWLFLGDIPFGVWRSREAAQRAAKRMQARGIVSVRPRWS